MHARFFNSPAYSDFEKPYSLDQCRNSPHYKVSKLQAIAINNDAHELEEYCQSLLRISSQSNPSALTYWDYSLYTTPKTSTPSINFADSIKFNARNTPCSSEAANKIGSKITWVFGGSTMQNGETSDENSIANVICKNSLSSSNPLQVINLGVGGFVSEMEIIKFVNLYKLSLIDKNTLPDFAIFYNGFNDSERLSVNHRWAGLPGNLSNKISKELSVNSSGIKAIYWSIRLLNKKIQMLAGNKKNILNDSLNRIQSKYFENNIDSNNLIFRPMMPSTEIGTQLLSSKSYIYDQTILSGICESLGVKCITILQPLSPLRKKPVGDIEINNNKIYRENGTQELTLRFYREVYPSLKKLTSNYYKVIDLSDFPNQKPYSEIPHFYDFGHTGFYSSEMIGNEISSRIKKLNWR